MFRNSQRCGGHEVGDSERRRLADAFAIPPPPAMVRTRVTQLDASGPRLQSGAGEQHAGGVGPAGAGAGGVAACPGGRRPGTLAASPVTAATVAPTAQRVGPGLHRRCRRPRRGWFLLPLNSVNTASRPCPHEGGVRLLPKSTGGRSLRFGTFSASGPPASPCDFWSVKAAQMPACDRRVAGPNLYLALTDYR